MAAASPMVVFGLAANPPLVRDRAHSPVAQIRGAGQDGRRLRDQKWTVSLAFSEACLGSVAVEHPILQPSTRRRKFKYPHWLY